MFNLYCLMFLYTLLYYIILFPRNSLQSESALPNGCNFAWLIQCGQLVTERRKGNVGPQSPSTQVCEGGATITSRLTEKGTRTQRQWSCPTLQITRWKCVVASGLPRKWDLHFHFYPMFGSIIWDAFRELIPSILQLLPCSHNTDDWIFFFFYLLLLLISFFGIKVIHLGFCWLPWSLQFLVLNFKLAAEDQLPQCD